MARRVEPQEIEFMKANAGKISAADIGKALNRSESAIKCWAIKMNISIAIERIHWIDQEDEKLISMRDIGVPFTQIAESLGRDVRSCYRRASYLRMKGRNVA